MTHCEYFDTKRKGNHCSFLTATVAIGRRLLPSEILADSYSPRFEKHRLRHIPVNMLCAGPVVVSGAWPSLHKTTGSADNCIVDFSDVDTAHPSRRVCLS